MSEKMDQARRTTMGMNPMTLRMMKRKHIIIWKVKQIKQMNNAQEEPRN
jgi:hypothetical protein